MKIYVHENLVTHPFNLIYMYIKCSMKLFYSSLVSTFTVLLYSIIIKISLMKSYTAVQKSPGTCF